MNEQIKIGSIIKQIRGVSYKPTDVREADEKNAVALLRANNIQETGLNFDDLVYIDRSMVKSEQYLRAGDILICSSSGSKNLVGKAAYVPEDLPCSFGAFCKVVRTQAVDSYYLGQYFQSPRYRQEISEASAGANINNIRNEHIDELTMPAHSKSEQMEIVQILLCLNKQIDCTKQQLAKLDELVKSRFIELFGSVEVNVFGFETIKIKDACDLINGKAFKPEDWSETGLPIVRIQNLNNDQAPFNFFNGEIKEQYLIDTGELLFSWSGTPGTSFGAFFWNRGKAVLNQHIFRVKPKIEFNLSFLQFALNGRIDHIISKAHGGVGLQHITKKELDEVELLLPAIELQNQFAAFFEQTDKSKLVVQRSLEKLETLKKSLMQQYFG